jgi:Acyl-coenzyme A:6-aminopenicillanic acid acyl-transferase
MMAAASPQPSTSSPSTPTEATPYERVDGIHVLRVKGTDYEMGYQHGQLLREAIPRGPVPYFARYVEKLLSAGLVGRFGGPSARLLGGALSATVGRRIAKRFPSRIQEALNGLADGAGLSRKELRRAVTMPETYLWVGSAYKKLFRSPMAPRYGVPVIGCTSAIAWGDATTHGRMLHGRNFDYQGVGVWDREQAVVFHDPKDGQKYVSIAAAGVLLGGVTAMNESGLSLVVHQHIACTDFDLDGLPIGVIGDEVMRQAKSLDDARRILDGHKPNGAWTYVITSAKENKAMAYEVTCDKRAVVEPKDLPRNGHGCSDAGGVFGYSNVYLAKELQPTEVDFYPSYWRNNMARFRRANERLHEAYGTIDADVIAGILGDIGEGDACRFSSISALTTVASVVFDPGRGIVYVATGRPPVCNRSYLAFELAAGRVRSDLPRVVGGGRIEDASRDAFDAYREAFEAHFNHADVATARREVGRARALQPRQAVYAFVAGLLDLAAKDGEAALKAFDSALELGHVEPQRLAAFHLWRGRTLDVLGRREEALAEYAQARHGDPNVRAAAEKNARKRYKPRSPALEWSFGDVISP